MLHSILKFFTRTLLNLTQKNYTTVLLKLSKYFTFCSRTMIFQIHDRNRNVIQTQRMSLYEIYRCFKHFMLISLKSQALLLKQKIRAKQKEYLQKFLHKNGHFFQNFHFIQFYFWLGLTKQITTSNTVVKQRSNSLSTYIEHSDIIACASKLCKVLLVGWLQFQKNGQTNFP